MKRFITLIIALLCLLSLCACNESDGNSDDVNYPSRTAAFYGNINKNSFWFKMNFTNNGVNYVFTQATDGTVVTTIEDHADNTLDKYHIYDGNNLHKLNLNQKTYDTVIGNVKAQGFLFEGYTPDMFANPDSTAVEQFEGKAYYCETFSTVSASGAVSGKNKYYFDGNKLKAVEIIEGGRMIMIMRFVDYSNEIPSDVYISLPEGYKAGTLQIEGDDVNYNDIFGKK